MAVRALKIRVQRHKQREALRMAKEIERKFLVDRTHPDLVALMSTPGEDIKQGYIMSGESGVVRIRTMGKWAFITVKGSTKGISRSEFEYEIPKADAEEMLQTMCGTAISKQRWGYPLANGREVEVDHFDQIDLMIAEVELGSEDESFEKPEWLLEEVSDNPAYFNNSIADKISTLGVEEAATWYKNLSGSHKA
jgi:adenylate cyclase